jgi:hypothetical protein
MLPHLQWDRLLDDLHSAEANGRLLNHVERHILMCACRGSVVRINYRDELRILLILATSAQHTRVGWDRCLVGCEHSLLLA